jgi:hypothetical protein
MGMTGGTIALERHPWHRDMPLARLRSSTDGEDAERLGARLVRFSDEVACAPQLGGSGRKKKGRRGETRVNLGRNEAATDGTLRPVLRMMENRNPEDGNAPSSEVMTRGRHAEQEQTTPSVPLTNVQPTTLFQHALASLDTWYHGTPKPKIERNVVINVPNTSATQGSHSYPDHPGLANPETASPPPTPSAPTTSQDQHLEPTQVLQLREPDANVTRESDNENEKPSRPFWEVLKERCESFCLTYPFCCCPCWDDGLSERDMAESQRHLSVGIMGAGDLGGV